MELLQCINLEKRFGDKEILKNVNLTIPRGRIVGLLGKNGTGKSTLIKLINDLLTVSSGQVLVNGQPVGVESKKIIAYLPERTYLDKTMTVDKVIKFFTDFYEDFDAEKARKNGMIRRSCRLVQSIILRRRAAERSDERA